jgi:hypothetical protein
MPEANSAPILSRPPSRNAAIAPAPKRKIQLRLRQADLSEDRICVRMLHALDRKRPPVDGL